MERIFFNMQLLGDDLFTNTTDSKIPESYGYFFPQAYIKRESVWTQDQVDSTFGPLITANKLKWAAFSMLLIFGLVFLVLTVFCGLRYKKLKASMETVNPEDEGDFAENGHRGSIQQNEELLTAKTGLLDSYSPTPNV